MNFESLLNHNRGVFCVFFLGGGYFMELHKLPHLCPPTKFLQNITSSRARERQVFFKPLGDKFEEKFNADILGESAKKGDAEI